jgi:hypothetical protein
VTILYLQPQSLPGGGVAIWFRVAPDGGWRLVCGADGREAFARLGGVLRGLQLPPGPPPALDGRPVDGRIVELMSSPAVP